MESAFLFAIISTTLILIGGIPYILGIVRKEVLPHPFSYGTWGILAGVNFLILLDSHAGWALLPAGVQLGFTLLYVIGGYLLFRRISINWFDYLCLFLGLMACVVWFASTAANAAVATVLVELIAMLPTIKKGWLQPRSEYLGPWIVSAFFPVFLLFASSDHSFASMAFWIYLMIENAGFSIMLWYRQKALPDLV